MLMNISLNDKKQPRQVVPGLLFLLWVQGVFAEGHFGQCNAAW
jgi:ABC-type thiamine transport system substrate-binding protein